MGDNVSVKIFMASRYVDQEFPENLVKQFEAVLVGDYDADYVYKNAYVVPQSLELCKDEAAPESSSQVKLSSAGPMLTLLHLFVFIYIIIIQ
jgi:hypothetical protein